MIYIESNLFEFGTHRVVRNCCKIDNHISSFQYTIRYVTNVTENLLIQFTLRQIVNIGEATCKESRVVPDQSSVRICFSEALYDTGAYVAHVSKNNDLHSCCYKNLKGVYI